MRRPANQCKGQQPEWPIGLVARPEHQCHGSTAGRAGLPRPTRPVHPRTDLHAIPTDGGRDRRESRTSPRCAAGTAVSHGQRSRQVRLGSAGPRHAGVAQPSRNCSRSPGLSPKDFPTAGQGGGDRRKDPGLEEPAQHAGPQAAEPRSPLKVGQHVFDLLESRAQIVGDLLVSPPCHTIATLTLWIGGSESNRQSNRSPPSRPIQSCPVVVPK